MIKKFSLVLFLGILSFSHVFGLSPIAEEENPDSYRISHLRGLESLLKNENPDFDSIQAYCFQKYFQFSKINQEVSAVYHNLGKCFSTVEGSKIEYYGSHLVKLRLLLEGLEEEGASQAEPLWVSFPGAPRGSLTSLTSQNTGSSQFSLMSGNREYIDEFFEDFSLGMEMYHSCVKNFFSQSIMPKIQFIRGLERGYEIHALDEIFKECVFIVSEAERLELVNSTFSMRDIIEQVQDYFKSMPSLNFNILKASGEKEKFPLDAFLKEITPFFKDFEKDIISQKVASGVWGLVLEIDKKVNIDSEEKRRQTKGATELSLAILRSYISGRDAERDETCPERVNRLFVAYLEALQYKFENMMNVD